MPALRYEVIGLKLSMVESLTDLAKLIVEAAEEQAGGLRDGDVVVTSKLYLKSVSALIDLSNVEPSLLSRIIAKICCKNPTEVEIILRNSNR